MAVPACNRPYPLHWLERRLRVGLRQSAHWIHCRKAACKNLQSGSSQSAVPAPAPVPHVSVLRTSGFA